MVDPNSKQHRKREWFRRQGIDVDSLNEEDTDEDAALTPLTEDGTEADIEELRERYTIEELHDEAAIEDEIEALRTKINALADRTPEHAARLSDRLAALESARDATANPFVDTLSWDALEQHGDFEGDEEPTQTRRPE